ncbi:MAG: hypothetical protein ORN98_10215, partial [Alphaproteobacteria bacterium]|nr:hypothetical protein [Alphaproteobacteria bacterium]
MSPQGYSYSAKSCKTKDKTGKGDETLHLPRSRTVVGFEHVRPKQSMIEDVKILPIPLTKKDVR